MTENCGHPDWLGKIKLDAENLSIEKRQEFLDYLHEGMTIGEAYTKAGITFDEANGVINMNIKSHEYLTLNKESE